MPLTNYPGYNIPSVLGVQGAGTLYPGSAILCFVLINGAGITVTSVSATGTTGLVFSRLSSVTVGNYRLEAWTSTPSATQQKFSAVVPTLSGAATATSSTAFAYANTTSFSVGGTNSGTTTAWSLTGAATAVQNSRMLYAIGQIRPATATSNVLNPSRSTPSTLTGDTVFGSADASTTLYLSYSSPFGGAVAGSGIAPFIKGTMSVAPTQWLGIAVYANGPVVALDDFTYQLTENGVLLNNPSNVVPIYDVETVDGLDDSTAASDSSEIDGADGSYVSAKFLTGKTIILSGTLYDTPPISAARIDTLKTYVRPTALADGVPFFYKVPGSVPRYILVKPISFKCSVDRDRGALGKAAFQLQMMTTDVRSFSPRVSGSQNTLASGTYAASIVVGGNIETYPIIYFNHYAGDGSVNPYTLLNSTWNYVYGLGSASITISTIVNSVPLPTGSYKLDLGSLTLTTAVVGQDFSSYITSRTPLGLVNGYTNELTLTRPTGSSITDEGFSWLYADAWF